MVAAGRHLPRRARPRLAAPGGDARAVCAAADGGRARAGASTETALAASALGAPGAVHAVADLRSIGDAPLADSVWDTLDPVGVDSTIALNFAVALGNETTVVPSTPPGAGRQTATPPAQNQLSSTYALTQIGIRRRPRFGPDAGVWTDLLAPADSELGGLGDLLSDTDPTVSSARPSGSAGTPT